jgi:heptaprenyl diphosphate synthase
LTTSAATTASQRSLPFGEQVSFIADSTAEALDARITPLLSLIGSQADRAVLASLLCGGKRIRTRVTALVALAIGQPDIDALVKACTALELLHTASLIHDDIIDGSVMRRGNATLHVQTNRGTAILVGDLLVGIAFAEVSTLGERAIATLSHAFTYLCVGQLSEASLNWGPEAQATIEQYARHKTGALFGAAFELGALTNGVPTTAGSAFRAAGESLGLAFQLSDDLLDVRVDVEDLDKDHGADIRNGIPTLPIWHAFQQLQDQLPGIDRDSGTVTELVAKEATSRGSREFTVHRISELLGEMRSVMPPVENRELIEDAVRVVLAGLPEYCLPEPSRGAA